VRNFLPKYAQPDADAIENLSMSIVVDQKRMGGGSHSTVGTITDINTILRMMFSRIGQPHVGPTNVFGFNDPQGMCPNCNGLGRKLDVDMDRFLDKSKSLNEGAIPIFEPGLEEVVRNSRASGRLEFTTDVAAGVQHGLFQFICVGTPQKRGENRADLRAVDAAMTSLLDSSQNSWPLCFSCHPMRCRCTSAMKSAGV
jgi:excinuclease UvrABC ATPase subunit